MATPPRRKRRKNFGKGMSTTTSVTLLKTDLAYIKDVAIARGVTDAVIWEEAINLYREQFDAALTQIEQSTEAVSL